MTVCTETSRDDLLEVSCPACHGLGGDMKDGRFVSTCKRCKGRRVVLTEFGKRILQFIRDHKDDELYG